MTKSEQPGISTRACVTHQFRFPCLCLPKIAAPPSQSARYSRRGLRAPPGDHIRLGPVRPIRLGQDGDHVRLHRRIEFRRPHSRPVEGIRCVPCVRALRVCLACVPCVRALRVRLACVPCVPCVLRCCHDYRSDRMNSVTSIGLTPPILIYTTVCAPNQTEAGVDINEVDYKEGWHAIHWAAQVRWSCGVRWSVLCSGDKYSATRNFEDVFSV